MIPRGALQEKVLTLAHVAPYATWIVGMFAVGFLNAPSAWTYVVKSVLAFGLILCLWPLRIYTRLSFKDCLLSVLIGLSIAALWMLPELCGGGTWRAFYHRWCILPLGAYPDYYPTPIVSDFEPSLCGWGLTIGKLLGSAIVIPVAEELFFRGWLYRWLQGFESWSKRSGSYSPHAFWIVVLVFAIEHDRYIGGALAGLAYGYLANIRGSMKGAILAHSITNLIIGLDVICAGHYFFW